YDDGMGRAVIEMNDMSTFGPFTIASGPQGNQGNDGPQGPQGEVSYNDMNNAISMAIGGTSNNSNSVATLDTPMNDPDMETLRQKLNELISALRR
ncbi:MAG: hypothetical protein NTY53_09020, partial [Kiritimatiellaeota bacterium]|nr:hypothetical protein [Kiritimatiellota bacterium]